MFFSCPESSETLCFRKSQSTPLCISWLLSVWNPSGANPEHIKAGGIRPASPERGGDALGRLDLQSLMQTGIQLSWNLSSGASAKAGQKRSEWRTLICADQSITQGKFGFNQRLMENRQVLKVLSVSVSFSAEHLGPALGGSNSSSCSPPAAQSISSGRSIPTKPNSDISKPLQAQSIICSHYFVTRSCNSSVWGLVLVCFLVVSTNERMCVQSLVSNNMYPEILCLAATTSKTTPKCGTYSPGKCISRKKLI